MQSLSKMLILAMLPLLVFVTQPTGAESPTQPEPPAIPIVTPPTIDQEIERIFGDKATIAKATIFHESNLNLKAINYNCHYYRINSEGKEVRYSRSCKPGDAPLAWSVDCGIGQINTRGKVCPAILFTMEGNMAAIERIYKTQGLEAWVSYTSGAYKKFMPRT